jgi:hypothetical protein
MRLVSKIVDSQQAKLLNCSKISLKRFYCLYVVVYNWLEEGILADHLLRSVLELLRRGYSWRLHQFLDLLFLV